MAGSHLDYSSLATSMVKMVSFMDMVLLNMNMLTDKALPACPPRPDRIQANDLGDEISCRSDFKSNKYTPKVGTQDCSIKSKPKFYILPFHRVCGVETSGGRTRHVPVVVDVHGEHSVLHGHGILVHVPGTFLKDCNLL